MKLAIDRWMGGEKPKFRLWCKRCSAGVSYEACDCYSCFWVTIDWRYRLGWWVYAFKLILGFPPRKAAP
jgi:hypothetical protein